MSVLRNLILGGLNFRPFYNAGGEGGGAAGGADPGAAAAPAAGATPVKVDGAAAPADSAAAAAAKPAGTIADGSTDAGKGAAAAAAAAATGKWPDKWREELAGDDKAYLATLQRFDSPGALAKSYRELQAKISSGELKAPAKPLPDNATPEQVTAWRKENGLPESVETVIKDLKLPNGLVPSEADKPLLNSFAQYAHANNLDQATVNKVASWYFENQGQAEAARADADALFKGSSIAALKEEWGGDFKPNINAVTNFLTASLPAELASNLLTARLANGNIAGNDPDFNRSMLMLAKQINPAATLLPAGAGNTLTGVTEKIAEHEANMRAPQGSDKWNAYWRSEKAQTEYRTLIGARDEMSKREKAA